MSFVAGQRLWSLVDGVVAIGGVDITGEWFTRGIRIEVAWQPWVVERVTPKGAWIRTGDAGDRIFQSRRWVSATTRLVAPTKALARENAIRKRKYHIKMARNRLELAEQRLRTLEQEDDAG